MDSTRRTLLTTGVAAAAAVAAPRAFAQQTGKGETAMPFYEKGSVRILLAQPSGFRKELPDLFYENNIKGWGPELVKRRPDITMEMVDKFLTRMYRTNADFVFTVTRDFVRSCQTPILVLPDDVPGHPYAVAMETVHLAPNAQVSLYPWKDTKDKIPLAVRHIRTFLRAHQPVAVAH